MGHEMEASIIRTHIESGRSYPRPRDQCDCCSKEVILCWGESRTHYWRHHAGEAADGHSPSCESATHKLAKKFLSEYLTQGGKCKFSHGCHGVIKELIAGCVKFVQEFTYKDIRWDVGCLGEDDRLLFGIEIRVTHVVNKTATRNEVPWIEVDANEILSLLDMKTAPDTITLKNITTTVEPCCLRKIELKTMSHLDIARELGFLVEDQNLPHRVVHSIAIQGKVPKQDLWQERGDRNTYQSLIGKEFLSRRKYLKCERHYDTDSCFRPYCGSCYKTISSDNVYEDLSYKVDPDLARQVRDKLSWMNHIAGNWELGMTCVICGDSHIGTPSKQHKEFEELQGESVRTCTWWFGDKKRICEMCFDSQCREQDLYKLIPE